MRAIVHIGFEKTGSTSIQKALKSIPEPLSAAGITYFNQCDGFGQHEILPFIACDTEFAPRFTNLIAKFGTPTAAAHITKNWIKEQARQSNHSTMLFSSELCSSLLYTCKNVWALRNFLAEIFEEIEIIVYLRRQDRLALSYYSTYLRMGGFSAEPLAAADRGILDYAQLAHRWMDAFGQANVKFFIYDDISREGVSVLQHFCKYLNICDGDYRTTENSRLKSLEMALMRDINSQMGPFNGATIRSAISLIYSDKLKSDTSIVSREEAIAYLSKFECSNEILRSYIFPEKKSLFDEDFSEYSEKAFDRGEYFTRLAVDTLAEAGRLISDLESQISLLRTTG